MQYTPVQNFINRMQEREQKTLNTEEVKGAYSLLITTATRHQTTYGEAGIVELIHYLDQLAGHPDLHPNAAHVVRYQADDLQQRLVVRSAVEAVLGREQ